MLTVNELSIWYESEGAGQSRVHALEDVTFDVERGEFVAIIGPSGCGKTSLLEAVAGLRQASSGQLEIDGQSIQGPHPDVGVVFQEDSTFPWLTTAENIEFGLKHRSVPKAERPARVAAMVDLVNLKGFENHRPPQLSGGMRQRVALARALAPSPKLLLMDEPFGALDEQSRLNLGDELLRIWRETSSTILFITHSLTEAAMLADKVIILSSRPGRVNEVMCNPMSNRSSSVIGTELFMKVTGGLWDRLRSDRAASQPASTAPVQP